MPYKALDGHEDMNRYKMSDLLLKFVGQGYKEQLNTSYLEWRDGWMDRQTTVAKVVDKWLPQLPCRLSMVSRCWPLLHTTVATAILPSADQAQSTVPLRGMVPERRCTHLLLLLWLTTCPLKGKMRANCTLLCRSVLLELKCVCCRPTIMQAIVRNTGKYSTILSITWPVVLYT